MCLFIITDLDVIFFGIVCFWSAGAWTHSNTSLSELHKLIILIELQKVNRNVEISWKQKIVMKIERFHDDSLY